MEKKTAAILTASIALYLFVTRLRRAINRLAVRFNGFVIVSSDTANNTSEAILRLVIRNSFPLSVRINRIRGNLYVQGAAVASVDSLVNWYLFKRSVSFVELPFTIRWSAIPEAIRNNLLAGSLQSLTIQFEGSLQVEGHTIPVNKIITYYDL